MSSIFDPDTEPNTGTHTGPRDESGDLTPEPSAEPSAGPSVGHRPSVLHLVVGLVFLGLAALWGLSASGVVSSEDTWLLPGLLVVAGVTGLVAALAGSRHRTR